MRAGMRGLVALLCGAAPQNGLPVEVVFSAFEWCALGSACA